MSIHVWFQISAESFQLFIQCDPGCAFFICCLDCVKGCFFYTQLKIFYHEGMWCFIKCFLSTFWDNQLLFILQFVKVLQQLFGLQMLNHAWIPAISLIGSAVLLHFTVGICVDFCYKIYGETLLQLFFFFAFVGSCNLIEAQLSEWVERISYLCPQSFNIHWNQLLLKFLMNWVAKPSNVGFVLWFNVFLGCSSL